MKEKQRFWHVIPAGGNLYEVRSGSEGFTVDEVPGMNFWPDQSMYSTVLPPKPRKMPGRPRKKRIRAIGEGGSSTRVSKVGVVGRPRKKQLVGDFKEVDVVQRGPVIDEGASGTREGAIGSRGRGGTVGSKGGANGSIGREAGGSGGASVSRGRGAAGLSGGQGKKMVWTSCFAKWFGLQDEPEQTQAAPQQTQHEPEQAQVEDQVE
ncbi:hypothetical protein Tco_1096286 [Tanacetum coccineum]